MGRSYTQDLTEWVVEAAEPTSRRQAATGFGVAAATAIRWMARSAAPGSDA